MTNENQKKNSLKKYKFLVPQIVNLAFIFFVCSMARVDGNLIVGLVMFSIFSVILSVCFYKLEFDGSYRKKAIARIEERKNLPRKDRYGIAAKVDNLIILLCAGIGLTIFSIIKNLLDHKFANAVILLIFALVVFLLIKVINKFFSKK